MTARIRLFERAPAASLLCGLLFALAAPSYADAQAEAAAALVAALRDPQLDPERAVALRNVEIELGPGVLDVDHAVLVPARPLDGRTLELVMIGNARFRVTPPDAIEADQLELFTGQRTLDTPIGTAVLVLADDATVARLLDRPAPRELPASLLADAEALLAGWRDHTARRSTGVEAGLFRTLVGDRAYGGYFAIWGRSPEIGDFVFQYDPEDFEQLTLASFEPVDLRGWERRRLERHIRMQQRKGRYLGMRVEDLGAWDIWMSSAWDDGDRDVSGAIGFEPRRYQLDVTIRRGSFLLDGRARIELDVRQAGRRVVPLELYRDLEVREVRDAAGTVLPTFRSGPEVLVLLSQPTRAGESLTLDVDFGGRALEWVGRKTWDLSDTAAWYPHCGSIDRALYDVTLRWPNGLDVVAGGRYVDGGTKGRYRWERRVIESPSIAFSFVLGRFEEVRRRVGDLDLRVAFHRSRGGILKRTERDGVVDTVARAVEFFTDAFGPLPVEELAVVTLPRAYSQSYLGFVTLADSVVDSGDGKPGSFGHWVRETTIGHEVAHQWWGNVVGWWSYRDQWLSEATANYAGLHFFAAGQGGHVVAPSDLSAGWRGMLETRLSDGRTVESLGPVVLGSRLSSSKAAHGYRAIVYRKGAAVLAMLARAVGEERFVEMLGALVEVARDRAMTTEAFLESIERMSGLDLDGFARQYVFGTGIPVVYYDYTVQPGDGSSWIVRGTAHRLVEPRQHAELVRTDDGRWDVRRSGDRDLVEDGAAIVVPVRIDLEPGLDGQRDARVGRFILVGEREEFEFVTESRPESLRLDPREEILARFVARESDPKRHARLTAEGLAGAGRYDDAERAYREALELPQRSDPRSGVDELVRSAAAETRREDATILLALARLDLDRGRDVEAAQRLEAVEDLLGVDRETLRMERDLLHARIDARAGREEDAYRRLLRTLRLAAPPGGPRSWSAWAWQRRLRSERLAIAEAYALLAATADSTGRAEERAWALAGAVERGAVVDLLRAGELSPGS